MYMVVEAGIQLRHPMMITVKYVNTTLCLTLLNSIIHSEDQHAYR